MFSIKITSKMILMLFVVQVLWLYKIFFLP